MLFLTLLNICLPSVGLTAPSGPAGAEGPIFNFPFSFFSLFFKVFFMRGGIIGDFEKKGKKGKRKK